ncbi:hypothetical protein [Microbacterium flavum]|uniref:Uncharacterized protein n=1 Tax=Microbacterium flavum TaxID=415216 RepID=A0ABS5XSH5_9MICO|nr:hypothetical protein [Microbacterium flavum]MBT8797458.1 hypothetical protein [Microbacterium flavum]
MDPLLLLLIVGIVVVVVAIVIAQSRSRRGSTEQPIAVEPVTPSLTQARAVQHQAGAQIRELKAAREEIERKTVELQDAVKRDVRRANFRQLRDMHYASKKTADAWYDHKRSATETRKRLSRGLDQYRERKRTLARQRDASSGTRRSESIAEISSVQSVIDGHYQMLKSIDAEISNGGQRLDQFNINTGTLRDYIRDNCGPEGREWYIALQARKQQRLG